MTAETTYDLRRGRPRTVATAFPRGRRQRRGMRAVHHLDLWVRDAPAAAEEWGWLLGMLGWSVDIERSSWVAADGTYLFLERSPAMTDTDHDRMRAGVNHVALHVEDRATLDRVRAESTAHGWHELFADHYPHAGGEQHVALYLESSEGFEVEVVVPDDVRA